MKRRTRQAAVTSLVLVAVTAWLSAGQQQPAASDARAIECGLVSPDFKAPLRIFSPDYYKTLTPACLQDRMAFYKVPGLTMALIDGNAIAWSKTYGVLEAGTTRAVTAESVATASPAPATDAPAPSARRSCRTEPLSCQFVRP